MSPVGVDGVCVPPVSDTVAVQVLISPITTVLGEHDTDVLVLF